MIPANLSAFLADDMEDDETTRTHTCYVTLKTDSVITAMDLSKNKVIYAIGEHGIKQIVNGQYVDKENSEIVKEIMTGQMKQIGKGQFGTVFLVKTLSNKYYALKKIHLKWDDEADNYIWREFHTIYTSESPHLVKLYECFYKETTVHLVMEYMDMGSLSTIMNIIDLTRKTLKLLVRSDATKSLFPPESNVNNVPRLTAQEHEKHKDLVRRMRKIIQSHPTLFLQRYASGQCMSENECGIIVRKVIEGLQYLRSKHIIHRDVKPSNILMSKNGEVKISDFGLSNGKNLDMVGNSGTVYDTVYDTICGTRIYLSPERLREEKYDYNCDLWSTGLVLVELFTGKHPQDTMGEVVSCYTDFNVYVTSALNILREAHASSEMIDFVTRCLQIDRKDRPSYDQILQHPFLGYLSSMSESEQNQCLKTNLLSWIVPFISPPEL